MDILFAINNHARSNNNYEGPGIRFKNITIAQNGGSEDRMNVQTAYVTYSQNMFKTYRFNTKLDRYNTSRARAHPFILARKKKK